MSFQEVMLAVWAGLFVTMAMVFGLACVMAKGCDRRSPEDDKMIDLIRKWREGK